jgi:hypothetical protein
MRDDLDIETSFYHVIWNIKEELPCYNASVVYEDGHIANFFSDLARREANMKLIEVRHFDIYFSKSLFFPDFIQVETCTA